MLPQPIRQALGLKTGDQLWVRIENGQISLIPRLKGIAEVLDSLPGHRPLVDLDPEELFAAEKASARQRWSR